MDELKAVWAATASNHDHDRIVRLLSLTGQRRDEWGQARWTEIKGDVLDLPGMRTKNGRPHRVPLVQLTLAQLPTRKTGRHYIFGRRSNWSESGKGLGGFSGWSKCKERLDKRCGVIGWTLHDLRRSFVTHASELELAPPHVIEAFVNHASGVKGGVAGVYNRAIHWEERCKLAEKWAALFG